MACHILGTPNMALRDAFDDPTLRAHEGELEGLHLGDVLHNRGNLMEARGL